MGLLSATGYLRLMRWFIALILTLMSLPVAAQDRRLSHCIALVDNTPGLTVVPVAFNPAPPKDTVRISYIDHAMFLIETPEGVSAVTDYSGYIGPADFAPDIATMNNAHSTHWTTLPDSRIGTVLEGWGTRTEPTDHNHVDRDLLVRNVHTDTRSGQFGGVARVNGNSIFIFEVAGLCIGHLGHLHHEPDPNQYAAIGRLDVVMIAVDGGLTLDTAAAVRVMERLRASVVIPMHWFARGTLNQFLDGMAETFEIDRTGRTSMAVSLRTLPSRPTVMVLEPRFLADGN